MINSHLSSQIMAKSNDLTRGNISQQLMKLALPLIATNFIQTSYSLTDMLWIGRLGTEAVVAVGTAGFFINMATALFSVIVSGTGIKIAHSYGAKNTSQVNQYIMNGYIMATLMAFAYMVLTIIFKDEIIGFFQLGNPIVETNAKNYLVISVIGTFFMFANALYSSIVNSMGNSQRSFKLNTVGFVVNIALDPLLIFGLGSIGGMGIVGAAYATVFSRIVVFALAIATHINDITKVQVGIRLLGKHLKEVVALGLPISVQRVAFTFISIVMARIISGIGPTGIGVQKIGLQVEALSFMTMAGMYGAMAAFIGQNYGAKNFDRIKEGYKKAFVFALLFGTATMLIMLIFPEQIFGLFLKEPETVAEGVRYLRVIGLSQIFMCVEIMTSGTFNGLGKTYIPAAVSLSLTTLRIPIAIVLSTQLAMGLDGVWWSISGTSVIKGILLCALLIWMMSKKDFKTSKS